LQTYFKNIYLDITNPIFKAKVLSKIIKKYSYKFFKMYKSLTLVKLQKLIEIKDKAHPDCCSNTEQKSWKLDLDPTRRHIPNLS
jgi:hypothetical protein